MKVLPINTFEVEPWLLEKHYAKRMCPISYAFGLYEDNNLVGVVTYGVPASPFLCMGVCGEEHKDIVLELNRLCLNDGIKNGASFLVGKSLHMLPKPTIVVSYADTSMNHIGYIYQASNFIFTGTTKERTDMAGEDGKHSRHNLGISEKRVNRSAKHRYIYFVGNKYQKRALMNKLNYSIEPYPKGDSQKYDSGKSVKTQQLLFA
tara:strand:+ start:267 stop:881 length:615 start_codon:yes stop_codon:yes gene_type:complete